MKKFLNLIFPAKPTPLEAAARELIEAEHAKLQAQTGAEYAQALVQYNDKRIARLLKFINDATAADK